MKRHLKSLAQLLLIWLAISLTVAAGAVALAVMDPLHEQPTHGSKT